MERSKRARNPALRRENYGTALKERAQALRSQEVPSLLLETDARDMHINEPAGHCIDGRKTNRDDGRDGAHCGHSSTY